MIKNILKIVLIILLVLILAIVAMFQGEIRTLLGVKKVDSYGFYEMDYKGDYGFDKFLEQGVDNDEDLVAFVSKQLLKGIPLSIDIPELGCSTFNSINEKGEYEFGRNFDLDYSPSAIVKTAPKNGYKSISMVNLAFLGYGKDALDKVSDRLFSLAAPYIPLDGVNEKGLSVAILLLRDTPTNQDTGKIDITSTTAIRLLLDKAATTDEAVKLLEQYDMHASAGASYHFQIADADGKSVIVEYIDNKMSVLTPEDKYFGATNFYLTPGEKYNKGHGQERYKIIMDTLKEKNGVLTNEEDMALLEKASTDQNYNSKSITQWSAVYNNTKKNVDVVVGRQYDKVYHFEI